MKQTKQSSTSELLEKSNRLLSIIMVLLIILLVYNIIHDINTNSLLVDGFNKMLKGFNVTIDHLRQMRVY